MQGIYNTIISCDVMIGNEVVKDKLILTNDTDTECQSKYCIDLETMDYNKNKVVSCVQHCYIKTVEELLEKLKEFDIKLDKDRISIHYPDTSFSYKTILVGKDKTEELDNGTYMIGLKYLD